MLWQVPFEVWVRYLPSGSDVLFSIVEATASSSSSVRGTRSVTRFTSDDFPGDLGGCSIG